MGTNYYAIANECDSCGRHERLHICKSFVWFQGHFTYDDDYEPHPWLISWQQWKQYLRSRWVSEVKDEYGRTHDIEDFIAKAEGFRPGPVGASLEDISPGADWVDPDGFQFTGRNFS